MLAMTGEAALPSAAHLKRFIHAAGPSTKRIAVFLLHCDANVSETLLLDWQQVDLSQQQIRFGQEEDRRVVDAGSRVLQVLTKIPHRSGRVFLRPDGSPYIVDPNRGGNLKTAFRETSQRAGIQPIMPSTLIRIRKGRQMLARLRTELGHAA